jgi:single-strand DNA-binding protein
VKGWKMSGINKAILIGNLGADPELRHTANGTPVANFQIATSERYNDRSGEKQERTEWHRIVAWAKLAEICNQYLTKGKKVYIEGRIQTRSWQDQGGTTKYVTEIVASNMLMLGGGKERRDEYEDPGPAQSPQSTPNGGKKDEDDLPF